MPTDSQYLRRCSVADPAVTVIITAYNGALYISEAINSILAQTFDRFELLIVDDHSTDNTLEIISLYDDSRITVIQNGKNYGAARSMNMGLSLARANYIARMDQDDIAYPERLQKQFTFMESNLDVGVCGTWAESFGISSNLMVVPVSDSDIKTMLFFDCPFIHPSMMLRRSVLLKLPLIYNDVLAEDYDLWLRLSALCKFHNIPEVLLRYRVHPAQITSRHASVLLDSAMLVRYSQAEKLLNRQLTPNEMLCLTALAQRYSKIDIYFSLISLCIELSHINRLVNKYPHVFFVDELYKRLYRFLRKAPRPPLIKKLKFFNGVFPKLIREFGFSRAYRIIKRGLKSEKILSSPAGYGE